MPKPFDLLVAGEINPDLILSDANLGVRFGQVETLVESATLAVGSSSVILACGAARLGLKTAFIGVVGKDLFGDFMLQAMQARGIDTRHVIVDAHQNTGLSVILSRVTDRAILTYVGAIDSLQADDISDEILGQARHLHIASYYLQRKLQPGLPALFSRAHALGLTTSLDTNWDPQGNWEAIRALLPLTDVFLPNENEALAISNTEGVEEILEILTNDCPTVAIKMGLKGAIACQEEAITALLPALDVEVIDTVGAGDSFDAGFLYGYLQGWELEHSLALGIACGSLSNSRPGGTAGQPSLEEALPEIPNILGYNPDTGLSKYEH
jgi:sugar/nucleoside kinase (ribokinase family)